MLNGTWPFRLSRAPAYAPDGADDPAYDDSSWDEVHPPRDSHQEIDLDLQRAPSTRAGRGMSERWSPAHKVQPGILR